MFDWERERDGLVVVVVAGAAVLFAEELTGALVVAREWGPLVFGAGLLVFGLALGSRAWSRRDPDGEDEAGVRETALLERQVDLLAAETAPQITVASWGVDGDALDFEVANVGNGAATDLTAVVEVGGVEARVRLRPEGGVSALAPGEEGSFRGEPVFHGELDDQGVVGVYSAAVGALRAAGADRLSVAVEYTDPTGRTERRRVWEAGVDLGDSLEATVESGRDAVDAEGLPPEA